MITTELPRPRAAFRSESQTKKKAPATIIIVLTAMTSPGFNPVFKGRYMATAKDWTMASAKVTYIFRRSTISELVFSRLKRFETVNIRHKIMEDIQGDKPIDKIEIPRRFPPITALESCRPVVVPSLSFKAFDKSTKGREILLPKT